MISHGFCPVKEKLVAAAAFADLPEIFPEVSISGTNRHQR